MTAIQPLLSKHRYPILPIASATPYSASTSAASSASQFSCAHADAAAGNSSVFLAITSLIANAIIQRCGYMTAAMMPTTHASTHSVDFGIVDSDVLHEPKGLAPSFKNARQGDWALVLTHREALHAAVDHTMLGTLPLAATPSNQEASTATMHRMKERLKWCGTSRPKCTPAQKARFGTETVPPHHVVQELYDRDNVLFPWTMDAWMREGNVAKMLRDGKSVTRDEYPDKEWGKAAGVRIGKRMCTRALVDVPLCGLRRSANTCWRHHHGFKRFGPTHRDSTPSTWAKTYLGSTITRAFASHIHHSILLKTRPKEITESDLAAALQADPRWCQKHITFLTPSRTVANPSGRSH